MTVMRVEEPWGYVGMGYGLITVAGSDRYESVRGLGICGDGMRSHNGRKE